MTRSAYTAFQFLQTNANHKRQIREMHTGSQILKIELKQLHEREPAESLTWLFCWLAAVRRWGGRGGAEAGGGGAELGGGGATVGGGGGGSTGGVTLEERGGGGGFDAGGFVLAACNGTGGGLRTPAGGRGAADLARVSPFEPAIDWCSPSWDWKCIWPRYSLSSGDGAFSVLGERAVRMLCARPTLGGRDGSVGGPLAACNKNIKDFRLKIHKISCDCMVTFLFFFLYPNLQSIKKYKMIKWKLLLKIFLREIVLQKSKA